MPSQIRHSENIQRLLAKKEWVSADDVMFNLKITEFDRRSVSSFLFHLFRKGNLRRRFAKGMTRTGFNSRNREIVRAEYRLR